MRCRVCQKHVISFDEAKRHNTGICYPWTNAEKLYNMYEHKVLRRCMHILSWSKSFRMLHQHFRKNTDFTKMAGRGAKCSPKFELCSHNCPGHVYNKLWANLEFRKKGELACHLESTPRHSVFGHLSPIYHSMAEHDHQTARQNCHCNHHHLFLHCLGS